MAGQDPAVRTYRAGDEIAINDGFNRANRCHRTLDEWSWRYPADPAGRMIVVAERAGEVFAHCGGIPLCFQARDRVVRAARIVDRFAAAEGADDCDIEADFIETFGGPEGVEVILRPVRPGGREREDRSAATVAVSSSQAFAHIVRSQPPPFSLRRLLYRAEPARDWEPRLDVLWRRVRSVYPAAVVRDAAYALRRLAGHPHIRYHRFLIFPRFATTPVGFVAFRCEEGHCQWVDLVWDHDHPGALTAVSTLSSRLAGQTGATLEELWLAGDQPSVTRLERLGFQSRGVVRDHQTEVLACGMDADVAPVGERLYLTMADTDEA